MKKGTAAKILVVLMLIVSVCVSATVTSFPAFGIASQNESVKSLSDEYNSVLYEEDFNDSEEVLNFADGKNATEAFGTWIYKKGTTASTGSASVKDGRLYFSGNKYDYLYLAGGDGWKNYTLEADFCYTSESSDSGWIGVMYNVIELSDGGVMAQKGGTLLPSSGMVALNGTKKLANGGSTWSNDTTQNKFNMATDLGLTVPDRNQAFRMKITVYENTATLYYAFLNDDETMQTPYIKIMSIDNIPEDAQHGSIGLMSSNRNLGSCWVDNIKCQRLLYEESFDNVQSRVDIASGTNTTGAAEGWIYAKNSDNSEAYIENGRLYFTGSKYDVLYRAGGEEWKNYTLEADFCYTANNSSKGWGGMLYNVQSATKFQKGGMTPAGDATLNGYDGNWSNNNLASSTEPTKNHYTMSSGAPVYAPFRMKIEAYNETASLYYAFLNEDGTRKTSYIHIMTIDNIPADARCGSVGFMTSSFSTTGSFWVDNIRCYENYYLNYAENFDDVTGRVNIQAGNNVLGAAKGWIYAKNSDNSEAYIENGRLYFSGSKYDVIYRDGGETWGNYTLEADFCYLDDTMSAGWGVELRRQHS